MATNNANKPATATVAAANAQGVSMVQLPVSETAKLHKYHATAANVPCANTLFRLAKGDGVTFAASGRNKAGRATVQALVQLAAAKAGATADKAVTGLAIVRAMQADAAIVEAYGATRAGKYAPRGTVPCSAWCSDYVTGNASGRVGLVVRATA